MTTDTTPRMTVAEIALMREIVRWRRANGIELFCGIWHLPDGRRATYDLDCQEIGMSPPSQATIAQGFRWHRVESVMQAVDVLTVFGYLPARFSSAYRRGFDAGVSFMRANEHDPATYASDKLPAVSR